MKALLKVFANILKTIEKHKITVYAAQATLFVVISVLPFTMLLISIIKYVIPFDKADIMEFIKPFLHTSIKPVVDVILGEVFSGATISVVSVTSVATVWAASKGMMALVLGLKSVYGTEGEAGYVKTRFFAFVYTLFFVVIVAATLLFSAVGRYFMGLAVRNNPAFEPVVSFIEAFPVIVYIVVLAVVCGLLYKILPGKGLTFINQLPGAAFTALGWVCFSAGYSFYISTFADYSYIYGSLTAVVLLILWLYFCMNIFLLGAEINCYLKGRKERNGEG